MSLPTFGAQTTAQEVVDVFADQVKGKNVIVTGTSLGGIGYETALAIAKYANLVVITGYNAERLQLAEDAIKKELPSANIRKLTLDLSSLAKVRKAAAEVNAYPEPIHVLINNAAAAIGPFKLTEDKLENQIATNHFGPFLFTSLILPRIIASKTDTYTPRIVVVSSAGHAFGNGVNFEQLENPDPAKHVALDAYMSSKSANILTASLLAKKLKGKVNIYSLHPGMIFTNINQKPDVIPDFQAMGFLNADGSPNTKDFPYKSLGQGAATQVVAAFDTRLEDKSGEYLSDGVIATETVAPHTADLATAEKLFALTEKIVGQTSPY